MSMFEAHARGLSFLKNEGVLEIPFFQRRYVWNEDNWIELYENLTSSDLPGFLGSIILKSKTRPSGDKPQSLVIDGQQRLTTLSIFVMALYDNMTDEDRKIYKHDLESTLFNSTNELDLEGNVIFTPKIKHSKLDINSFNYIMDIKNNNKVKTPTNEDKIIECYNYFYKEISKDKDYEKRKKLFNILVNSLNEIIVVIDISSGSDEQKVFDTLNSAGVRLTMADTIKNYLFNKVEKILVSHFKELGGSTENVESHLNKTYESTWEKTFIKGTKKDEDKEVEIELDTYWNKEVTTGRIQRTHIDLFLQYYATIKGFYNPKETLTDLPNIYKSYINSINDIESMNKFLKELCYFADLYFDYFLNRDEDYKYYYDKENVLPRILLFEDMTGVKTLNPYILHLIALYSNSKGKLNEELHKIEKMLIYTYLTKNTSRSKNYNKLVVDFIKDENRIDEEIKDFGDMTDGINGLKNLDNYEGKFFLFLIELYRRREDENDIKELEFNPNSQLEHIMPRKWQKYWTALPKENDEKEKLNTLEEKENYRNSKIYYLGNMTILNSKLNNKISNSFIDKKINGEGSLKGIRGYTDFRVTKQDVIEYFDKNHSWDEKRINERTEELYKELKTAILY